MPDDGPQLEIGDVVADGCQPTDEPEVIGTPLGASSSDATLLHEKGSWEQNESRTR